MKKNYNIIVVIWQALFKTHLDKKPTILVCPLDWGIGHASRCVPIIHELIRQQAHVLIGASKRPLAFLKREFPELEFIDFPGHPISYPANGKAMGRKMFSQMPSLIQAIRKEHHFLEQLIGSYKLDGVISDNRYGLYSKRVPTVFMSHQIFIQTPHHLQFLKPILLWINFSYIKRFDEYWVPDVNTGENLSGNLSHQKPLPGNGFFIGPLSRFANTPLDEPLKKPAEKTYDVLIMLSGPEPQRTILEELLLKQIDTTRTKVALIQGKPEISQHSTKDSNPAIFSHLDTPSLRKLILNSKVVISRSGYSTLMDLVALKKQAVFIPTPGQTEQEYLANYHEDKKHFYFSPQHNFNLEDALEKVQQYRGIPMELEIGELKLRVRTFLERIKRNN